MQKIEQYDIIIANSHRQLSQYINDWIRTGWQPIGGVEIHRHNKDSTSIWYYQSIVKYEKL